MHLVGNSHLYLLSIYIYLFSRHNSVIPNDITGDMADPFRAPLRRGSLAALAPIQLGF